MRSWKTNKKRCDRCRFHGDQKLCVYPVLVMNLQRHKYGSFRWNQERCAYLVPVVKNLRLQKYGSLRGDQESFPSLVPVGKNLRRHRYGGLRGDQECCAYLVPKCEIPTAAEMRWFPRGSEALCAPVFRGEEPITFAQSCLGTATAQCSSRLALTDRLICHRRDGRCMRLSRFSRALSAEQ